MGWLEDALGINGMQPPRDYLRDEFSRPRPPAPDPFGLLGAVPPQPVVQEPAPSLPPVALPAPIRQLEPEPRPSDPRAGLPMLTEPAPAKATPFEKEQRQAAQSEAQAVMDMAAAKAAKEREVADRSALEAHRSLTELQNIETERQQGAADNDQRQRAIFDEATELSKREPDPRRRFKNATTGEKIGVVIFGALSGLMDQMDPKRGGRVEWITNFIDREVQKDVDLQLRAIDQSNKALGFKQSALNTESSRQQQNLDNRLRAETMAYGAAMDIIKAEAARHDSPIAQAAAQQAMAGIQGRLSASAQQHRDQQEGLRLQKSQVGVSWFNAKENQRQFDERLAFEREQALKVGDFKKVERLQQERQLAVPGVIDPKTGTEFLAPDKESAQQARTSVQALSYVNNLLERRDALRAEYGSETLPSQAKDRMLALDRQLLFAVKDAEKTGALDKGSLEVIAPYLGDTTRYGNISAQNDEIRRGLVAKTQAHLVSLGFTGEIAPMPLRTTGLQEKGLVDRRAPSGRAAPRGMPASTMPASQPLGTELPPWVR